MSHSVDGPIVLCGADAVGKSSVAVELGKKHGARVFKTPGPMFDAQRALAERLTPYGRFCFYQATVAMTALKIADELPSGSVIVDRYIQCTAAFHYAMGVKVPRKIWKKLAVPEPRISIHLTVSPKEARRRIEKRRHEPRPDACIEEDEALQGRVVEAYRELFMGSNVPRGFRLVEISTDGKTPKQVAAEIDRLLR